MLVKSLKAYTKMLFSVKSFGGIPLNINKLKTFS